MLRKFSRPFVLIFLFLFLNALPILSQQLDPNFGTNGLVLTNFPPPASMLFTITRYAVESFPMSDGTILTLAQVNNLTAKGLPSITARLLRYSNDGTYLGAISSEDNFVATDAVQQPNGKIVAVGYTYGNYSPSSLGELNWKIVRSNQDGSLDTSFNTTGVVVRGFAQNEDIINSVVLQPDGKIVVVGTSANNSNGRVTIVGRYNADGSVDTSFGPYGEGFFDIYDGGNLSRKVMVTANGKILLGGFTLTDGFDRNLVVVQYNPNGTPDTSFGNQGAAVVADNSSESFFDFALQTDGRIVLLAASTYGFQGTLSYIEQLLMVVRLNANGSPDPIFGSAGRTFINTSPAFNSSPGNYEPAGSETPLKILVENDGNILFTAVSRQLLAVRRDVLMVFRLNPTGRVIGRNFTRRTPASQAISVGFNTEIKGLIKDFSGKILISGGVPALPQGLQIALARYTALSAVNNANHFFDYNYDGRAEFAVYRPSGSGLGLWLFLRSHTMLAGAEYQFHSREYGMPGDIIVPGDYDGDGIQDLAVFRPATGEWITRKIYLDNCAPMSCAETIQFGTSGDIPAPGDFDGDAITDRTVFRPSEGNWYILFSTGGYTGFHFGQNGDKPVTGDYDGDGKSDAAVVRQENGKIFWYIPQSSNNQFVAFQFGNSEDKTAVADYNGDGKTEVAVWRPSNGTFYVLTNYTDFSYQQLGSNGDVPIPADFDGDKKDEFAVYTPSTGAHTFIRSSDGSVGGTQFGLPTDAPMAAAYVR